MKKTRGTGDMQDMQMKEMVEVECKKIISPGYKRVGILLLTAMTLNMTGCAIFQTPPVKYLPNDNSMIALNHIADKAQQSTEVLAEIQLQNKQNKQNAQRNYAAYSHGRYTQYKKNRKVESNIKKSESMEKSEVKVSFSFEGPVNLAVQKLSEACGYQSMISANQLKAFPVVSVIESNTPLSSIVERINQQLPKNLKVICYPKTKTLLLIIQSTGA